MDDIKRDEEDPDDARYKYGALLRIVGSELFYIKNEFISFNQEIKEIKDKLQAIYGCLWVGCGCAILATLKYVSS
jgi:hypothetical protein